MNNLSLILGVYIWSNGDKARITFEESKIIFGNRLIFSDSDVRLEYRGGLEEGHSMHGQGTLTLRDGKTAFKGTWADSICSEHDPAIQRAEQEHDKAVEASTADREKFRKEND